MKTCKVPKKLILTVRRPSGEIETVEHPNLKSINEAQFKQMQKATAEAGRGDIIDYKVEYSQEKIMTSGLDIIKAASSPSPVAAMSRMGERHDH